MAPAQRQATLADAVARRARREAAESASVASAVEMERASAEVPRAELFEKTQARMEELTAQHYRKYADIMAEAPKGQQVNAVARRETGCDEGMRFVRGVEDLGSSGVLVPASVTKDLKEVVLNHAKHSDATLSPRAAALLRRIVRAQPPARVAMPAEVPTHCPPSHGSQSFSQVDVAEDTPIVVVAHAAVQPWAALSGRGDGAAIASPAKPKHKASTSRSAAAAPAAAAPCITQYGTRWLQPALEDLLSFAGELGDAAKPVQQGKRARGGGDSAAATPDDNAVGGDPLERADTAEARVATKVAGVLGKLWVTEYLVDVWAADLAPRLEVAKAHGSSSRQQKATQRLLSESHIYRALDAGTAANMATAVATAFDVLKAAAAFKADEDKPAVVAACAREVAACAAAAAGFVRLAISVLSALEDAGAAGPRSSVALHMNRQALDRAVVKSLRDGGEARAWDAVLSALPPRDRLRALFFFLMAAYQGCSYERKFTAKHHACALFVSDVYARYSGAQRADHPATFIDVPPSVTMQLLTHAELLIAQWTWSPSCFNWNHELLCTFVVHMAAAAVRAVPALVNDGRFEPVTDAFAPHADPEDCPACLPLGSIDSETAFGDTYRHAAVRERQRDALRGAMVRGELAAVLRCISVVSALLTSALDPEAPAGDDATRDTTTVAFWTAAARRKTVLERVVLAEDERAAALATAQRRLAAAAAMLRLGIEQAAQP